MTDDSSHQSIPFTVQAFRAEALGQPGQRRFRLMVQANDETWIMWMEKQQMHALGLALAQILQQAGTEDAIIATSSGFGPFDEETTNQFRLGRVDLGFDESDSSLIVVGHNIQEDEDDTGLGLRFSQAQVNELIRESAALVAAGRPLCPMCGQPRDPEGHVCPEQNGHLPLLLDDALLGDE